jgi:plasmid stability protein
MPALVLNDLPETVLARLKERAAMHGRTVEAEAVECIEQVICSPGSPGGVELAIAELQRFRSTLDPGITVSEDQDQAILPDAISSWFERRNCPQAE